MKFIVVLRPRALLVFNTDVLVPFMSDMLAVDPGAFPFYYSKLSSSSILDVGAKPGLIA